MISQKVKCLEVNGVKLRGNPRIFLNIKKYFFVLGKRDMFIIIGFRRITPTVRLNKMRVHE